MKLPTVQHLVDVALSRTIAFLGDGRAVSTVEYALIVVAVIAVVGGAATLLGGSFNDMFNTLGNQLENAITN